MSANKDIIQFKVYRFDPDHDKKPTMKTYEVDVKTHECIMVLDALLYIKDHLDPTLSFRRSCREGNCGSDGMNMNGKNGLACVTHISSLKSPIIVRPLPGLPVIKDLIIDMTLFYEQYEKVEPYLQNEAEPPMRERLQSPEDRDKLNGLYECILCACCSTACPSYWWNPDKFLGPAALIHALRFIDDSRDTARTKRLQQMEDAYSVFRCRSIMNCVNVCPKKLNPTKAIGKIKQLMLKEEN